MAGVVLASPVWLYQLWAFVAPGLHRHEKKYAYAFVGTGAPLFLVGAYFAYWVLPDHGQGPDRASRRAASTTCCRWTTCSTWSCAWWWSSVSPSSCPCCCHAQPHRDHHRQADARLVARHDHGHHGLRGRRHTEHRPADHAGARRADLGPVLRRGRLLAAQRPAQASARAEAGPATTRPPTWTSPPRTSARSRPSGRPGAARAGRYGPGQRLRRRDLTSGPRKVTRVTSEITLFVNPTAGRGRGAHAAQPAASALRAPDSPCGRCSARTRRTRCAGPASAVAGGTGALVAVGGDGMANLALQAVAGTRTPFGLVAVGTGNDFARALGLPVRRPGRRGPADRRGAQGGGSADIDLGRVGTVVRHRPRLRLRLPGQRPRQPDALARRAVQVRPRDARRTGRLPAHPVPHQAGRRRDRGDRGDAGGRRQRIVVRRRYADLSRRGPRTTGCST